MYRALFQQEIDISSIGVLLNKIDPQRCVAAPRQLHNIASKMCFIVSAAGKGADLLDSAALILRELSLWRLWTAEQTNNNMFGNYKFVAMAKRWCYSTCAALPMALRGATESTLMARLDQTNLFSTHHLIPSPSYLLPTPIPFSFFFFNSILHFPLFLTMVILYILYGTFLIALDP